MKEILGVVAEWITVGMFVVPFAWLLILALKGSLLGIAILVSFVVIPFYWKGIKDEWTDKYAYSVYSSITNRKSAGSAVGAIFWIGIATLVIGYVTGVTH